MLLYHFVLLLILFFSQTRFSTKLKAFYLAEVVKFLFTILLVITFLNGLKLLIFTVFSGFMVALILNNLLPFCLDKTASILLFFIQGIYYVRTNLD